MNRSIIFLENHFIEFYQMQDQKVNDKIQYVFELIISQIFSGFSVVLTKKTFSSIQRISKKDTKNIA